MVKLGLSAEQDRKRGRREKRREKVKRRNERSNGGNTMWLVKEGPVFSHLGMVNIPEGFSEVRMVRMGVGGL